MKKKKILYADDDFLNREIVSDILESYFSKKIDLEVFEDGSSLEKRLQKGSEGIDLVITDNQMPGFYGGEIIRKYAKKNGYEKIPFVLLFGGDYRIGEQAVKEGAADYIIKGADAFINLIKVLNKNLGE